MSFVGAVTTTASIPRGPNNDAKAEWNSSRITTTAGSLSRSWCSISRSVYSGLLPTAIAPIRAHA